MRNDRPLAKDLPESRLFLTWRQSLVENMLGKEQFISVAILTERYFIIIAEIIRKQHFYCISLVGVQTHRHRPVGSQQRDVQ